MILITGAAALSGSIIATVDRHLSVKGRVPLVLF